MEASADSSVQQEEVEVVTENLENLLEGFTPRHFQAGEELGLASGGRQGHGPTKKNCTAHCRPRPTARPTPLFSPKIGLWDAKTFFREFRVLFVCRVSIFCVGLSRCVFRGFYSISSVSTGVGDP